VKDNLYDKVSAYITEKQKLEAEIDMANEGLLDEVALRIPMLLNWEAFIVFRQDFISKFQVLLELRSKIQSELINIDNQIIEVL